MILPDKGVGYNNRKQPNSVEYLTLHRDLSDYRYGTIGRLMHNSKVLCLTLENPDRKLNDNMSIDQIMAVKGDKGSHYKDTAIQTGTFEVRMSRSGKFSGEEGCCNSQRTKVKGTKDQYVYKCKDCVPYKCGNCQKYFDFYNKNFKGMLPEVIIKGWEGVRMHWGESKGWTEGCILLGSHQFNKPNGDFSFSEAQSKAACFTVYKYIGNLCVFSTVLLKVLPPTKRIDK